MPFHQPDAIRYYTSESLSESGLVHAVFTRRGGVSPAPWAELNVGGTVGDARERVIANRLASFATLGRAAESLYDVWQVHGNTVICANTPRPPEQEVLKADAILTDRPEVTLFMRFADCTPILLHDPVRKVAGIVHAGWQGTVRQATRAAVERMQAVYGCRVENIRALIGPSIGPDHYEVGDEVVAAVQDSLGMEADAALQRMNGEVHLDLWKANEIILERAGVQQVEITGLCTACQLDDWYSHRAERGKTGRFGALVALES